MGEKRTLVLCCVLSVMVSSVSLEAKQLASQNQAQSQTELGKLIGTVEQMDKRLDRIERQLESIDNRIDNFFSWFLGAVITLALSPIARDWLAFRRETRKMASRDTGGNPGTQHKEAASIPGA